MLFVAPCAVGFDCMRNKTGTLRIVIECVTALERGGDAVRSLLVADLW